MAPLDSLFDRIKDVASSEFWKFYSRPSRVYLPGSSTIRIPSSHQLPARFEWPTSDFPDLFHPGVFYESEFLRLVLTDVSASLKNFLIPHLSIDVQPIVTALISPALQGMAEFSLRDFLGTVCTPRTKPPFQFDDKPSALPKVSERFSYPEEEKKGF